MRLYIHFTIPCTRPLTPTCLLFKNPVKIDAVKDAFTTVWPDGDFSFEGIDVPSDVSEFSKDIMSPQCTTNRYIPGCKDIALSTAEAMPYQQLAVSERVYFSYLYLQRRYDSVLMCSQVAQAQSDG